MSASTPPGGHERRRHCRYELLAQVHVQHSAEDFVLELNNISGSGAMVQLGSLERPVWVDVGRKVQLGIIVPMDLDTVQVSGTIMRVEQKGQRWGFAVQFGQVDATTRTGLDRLIALGRPQPPPLPSLSGAPPSGSPERRHHPRFELLAAVHTHHADEDYVLELGNISRSGASMQLGTLDKPSWVRVGEQVDVAIIDPERLDQIPIRGRIVRLLHHQRRWGFAVTFDEPDDAARAGIERLIALGRLQPPPLPT